MEEVQLEFFKRMAESGNQDPWGLAYRAASGRSRPPHNVVSGITYANEHPGGVTEAMTNMVQALCPNDDASTDSAYHRTVRLLASVPPSVGAAPSLSLERLGSIVRQMPNTAPGIDGVSARILKEVWDVASVEVTLVVKKCVDEGIFPRVWKDGRLIVLPKGNGKPLSDPKAYRPITLLPVLGKLLERVMLQCAPMIGNQISASQHGFSRGRSTVTALLDMLEAVRGSPSRYVQAIFLDISGAFDNAWWPMILAKVKGVGCPSNIYRMLMSYFTERRVGMFVGDQVVWKTSTMGCPQGSVLGPTLWNRLMDDLLRLPLPGGVRMIAYADDVTVLIEAQSRAEIERTAATVTDLVCSWGARNRLGFSPGKSSTMTLKGRFQRPPTIRMAGESVRSVTSTTVLGVVIDASLSFSQHALAIGERAAKGFGKMSRVSASSWGIRFPALRLIYQGTFVATVTYAAACWYQRATLHVVRSALLRTQRTSLVLLTKAYRSTSSNALAVLAGVLPADLEVIRAGRLDEARLIAADTEEAAQDDALKLRKRVILNETMDAWQTRWMTEEKGRETQRFFPEVSVRLSSRWVEPDYYVSQILTGHGCFRKRLCEMKLVNESVCYCGEEDEDLHHVLWVCPLYLDIRREMLGEITRSEEGPVYYTDLVSTPANFKRLSRFAQEWHKMRSAMEREERERETRQDDESSNPDLPPRQDTAAARTATTGSTTNLTATTQITTATAARTRTARTRRREQAESTLYCGVQPQNGENVIVVDRAL